MVLRAQFVVFRELIHAYIRLANYAWVIFLISGYVKNHKNKFITIILSILSRSFIHDKFDYNIIIIYSCMEKRLRAKSKIYE